MPNDNQIRLVNSQIFISLARTVTWIKGKMYFSANCKIQKVYVCHDTTRYDVLYLRAAKRWRIASLICRTEPNEKRTIKNLKTKGRGVQKKRSGREVHGVSPEAGRESMVGKICERGSSWAGSESERELWMVRVVSWQKRCGRNMNRQVRDKGLQRFWRRELGSWF